MLCSGKEGNTMKCSKCGNKEAVFFYSSDINGQKSRGCLCADCAREEGLTGSDMGFGSFGGLFGGVFSDFFAPERSLLSSFGSFGAPFRSIMAPSAVMPEVGALGCSGCGEPSADIPADAGAEIRRRRELEAVRQQINAAVSAEDYEKAAELRDKLRAMERDA